MIWYLSLGVGGIGAVGGWPWKHACALPLVSATFRSLQPMSRSKSLFKVKGQISSTIALTQPLNFVITVYTSHTPLNSLHGSESTRQTWSPCFSFFTYIYAPYKCNLASHYLKLVIYIYVLFIMLWKDVKIIKWTFLWAKSGVSLHNREYPSKTGVSLQNPQRKRQCWNTSSMHYIMYL